MTTVTTEWHDRVAVLTLNRPHVRNAIDRELAGALTEAVRAAQSAACIVLTGAGSAFCAGLDLAEAAAAGFIDAGWLDRTFGASAVPLVAAVNGPAATGGLEVVLACDIVLASESARFADTHGLVGTIPGGGMATRLSARVGVGFARQMSYTGAFVDAATALRVGLVNEVLPGPELLPRAVALGTAMAAVADPVLRAVKRLYDDATALAPGAGLAREQELFAAFTAARAADFSGFHERLGHRG
ncbi:hypothetical protein BJF78_14480 [Pseudonocardia sp. CNS-139]|nr:hypothetical protein BJF78_14480 [Pseudonocardia sp. CNS-139]